MEYYTVDKFNRGFRVGDGGGGENLDEKIKQVQKTFNRESQKFFNRVEDQLGKKTKDLSTRVDAIEKIGKLYSVTNTYFSTKGRRIVSVGEAKDKTDVIIKRQLDDAIDKLEKKVDKHIKAFEDYKANVNSLVTSIKPKT